MSIRVALLILVVLALSVYAWKNWFWSLCGAIALIAVIQHPDFPNSMGGIQGLNLWNVLLLNIVLAWSRNRKREGYEWDMPPPLMGMLVCYFLVVFWSYVRLVLDPSNLDDYSFASATSEYLINAVKWVIPGILLYDGCRTRPRMIAALVVMVSVYFGLAVQIIRWMPMGEAMGSGAELQSRAAKILVNEVGFHRVNLSMMLSGAFWATMGLLILCRKTWQKGLIFFACFTMLFGQALTGGRTGYATWGLIGFALCLTRWRRLLPLIPAAIIMVVTFVPGVRERMLQGFGGKQGAVKVQTDDYEITSGRTLIWPFVLEKIGENPLFGYGRQAMIRTGITMKLFGLFGEGEDFPHPHNAYLEILLDNGIIGFVMVVPFYFVVLRRSFPLFLDRRDPLCSAAGAAAIALVLALMIAALGSQTFYPREGAVMMWAAIGIMLRASVERQKYGFQRPLILQASDAAAGSEPPPPTQETPRNRVSRLQPRQRQARQPVRRVPRTSGRKIS